MTKRYVIIIVLYLWGISGTGSVRFHYHNRDVYKRVESIKPNGATNQNHHSSSETNNSRDSSSLEQEHPVSEKTTKLYRMGIRPMDTEQAHTLTKPPYFHDQTTTSNQSPEQETDHLLPETTTVPNPSPEQETEHVTPETTTRVRKRPKGRNMEKPPATTVITTLSSETLEESSQPSVQHKTHHRPGTSEVSSQSPVQHKRRPSHHKKGSSNVHKKSKKSSKGFRRILNNEKIDPDSPNYYMKHPPGYLMVNSTLKLSGSRDLTNPRIASMASISSDMEDAIDPSSKFSWELRRYDRACLLVEHNMRKSFAKIPYISEDTSREVHLQNDHLSRVFLKWYFDSYPTPDGLALGDLGRYHPHQRTFKFLAMTVHIFTEKICTNFANYASDPRVQPPMHIKRDTSDRLRQHLDFSPQTFIRSLFLLFLTLRVHTAPRHIPDYPTASDEANILNGILTQCLEHGPQTDWFMHSCGDSVLSGGKPNNYACTPLHDYVFNDRKYDPILDGMWFMFNAVQGYCFNFFSEAGIKYWHKYGIIMANTFTPRMRMRWESSVAEPKWFTRLLGPSKNAYYNVIERCTFGTVLASEFPAIGPRFSDPNHVITFGQDRKIFSEIQEFQTQAGEG